MNTKNLIQTLSLAVLVSCTQVKGKFQYQNEQYGLVGLHPDGCAIVDPGFAIPRGRIPTMSSNCVTIIDLDPNDRVDAVNGSGIPIVMGAVPSGHNPNADELELTEEEEDDLVEAGALGLEDSTPISRGGSKGTLSGSSTLASGSDSASGSSSMDGLGSRFGLTLFQGPYAEAAQSSARVTISNLPGNDITCLTIRPGYDSDTPASQDRCFSFEDVGGESENGNGLTESTTKIENVTQANAENESAVVRFDGANGVQGVNGANSVKIKEPGINFIHIDFNDEVQYPLGAPAYLFDYRIYVFDKSRGDHGEWADVALDAEWAWVNALIEDNWSANPDAATNSFTIQSNDAGALKNLLIRVDIPDSISVGTELDGEFYNGAEADLGESGAHASGDGIPGSGNLFNQACIEAAPGEAVCNEICFEYSGVPYCYGQFIMGSLIGDVNGDRKVDNADLLLMDQHLDDDSEGPVFNNRYDLNRDNAVDCHDVDMITDVLPGGPTELTYGTSLTDRNFNAPQPVTNCEAQIVLTADAGVEEGETVGFTIALTRTPVNSITVNYETQSITAQPGEDYQPVSGSVTFAAGASGDDLYQDISVPTIENETPEEQESFQIVLTNTQGVPFNTNSSAVVIITDDDEEIIEPEPVNVSFVEASQASNEDEAGEITLEITFNGSVHEEDIVINYSILPCDDGNQAEACADSLDHDLQAGSIVIPAGQDSGSFSFNVHVDDVEEQNEILEIQIDSEDPMANIVEPSVHTLRIFNDDIEAVQVDLDRDIMHVGFNFKCSVNTEGNVSCSGSNYEGRLGIGAPFGTLLNPVTRPTAQEVNMPGGALIKQLTGGAGHTCALSTSGDAYCWGTGGNGQTGQAPSPNVIGTPTVVDMSGITGSTEFTRLGGGYKMNCGIMADNKVVCWGEDPVWLLQTGTPIPYTPHYMNTSDIPANETIVDLAVGKFHMCLLTEHPSFAAKKAYCMGSDLAGQLGNGGIAVNAQKFQPVDAPAHFQYLSSAWMHSCGLTLSGDIYCWGNDASGQLGNNSATVDSQSPVQVQTSHLEDQSSNGTRFEFMTTGSHTTCAINKNHKSFCWGSDSHGELGDHGVETGMGFTGLALYVNQPVPSPIDMEQVVGNLSSIKTNGGWTGAMTCARSDQGQDYCWGNNEYGQYGNGTYDRSTFPVPASE